ncbi:MAG TPA: PASTA domain-containing protein [Candidatus Kapabacteria bacterium]|nr:PASTA domain-containing protein [Candidatus Kapabacteria bacterium]
MTNGTDQEQSSIGVVPGAGAPGAAPSGATAPGATPPGATAPGATVPGSGASASGVQENGTPAGRSARSSAAPPAAEEPEPRVRWLVLMKYLVIGIVAVIVVLVLLDKVVMPWYVKAGSEAKVPEVVGLPFAEAQKRLEKLGFEVKKGESRFDDRYPAGMVVMQLPYGGQVTKEGRRVYLTLSRGTELIPVPDLTGMPLREARINLMRNGFDIGDVTYEHNDTIMKDLVYWQSIPPKVPARPGANVAVMISRGPSTRFIMMPSLLSLDIEQARARLDNAGLVMGVVRYKENPAYAKNTVIEQTVAPYAQVAQGAAVDVTISGTPDPESDLGTEGDEEGPHVHNPEPKIAPKPIPPVAVRPAVPKPAAPKPATPKHTAPKTSQPNGAAPKHTSSKPASSKPVSSKPSTSKPASSKPASSKPATSKPAATKPATSKPAATKPAAPKPAHPKPTETKPTQP